MSKKIKEPIPGMDEKSPLHPWATKCDKCGKLPIYQNMDLVLKLRGIGYTDVWCWECYEDGIHNQLWEKPTEEDRKKLAELVPMPQA